MTNKEYFEKNNISFANAMKMYDVKKYGTFEQFLYAKHEVEHKFNVGDILISELGWCFIVHGINERNNSYQLLFKSTAGNLVSRPHTIFGIDNNNYIKIGHSDFQFTNGRDIIFNP